MRKPAKAADFLSKLLVAEPDEPAPTERIESKPAPTKTARSEPAGKAKIGRPTKRAGGGRSGLKHLGGYVDDETAERFALLKIRLKQGNDELIKTAIDALYRQESAKRKFGD